MYTNQKSFYKGENDNWAISQIIFVMISEYTDNILSIFVYKKIIKYQPYKNLNLS